MGELQRKLNKINWDKELANWLNKNDEFPCDSPEENSGLSFDTKYSWLYIDIVFRPNATKFNKYVKEKTFMILEEAKKEFEEAFKIVGIAESYEKLLEIHEKWFCGSKQQKT